MGRRVTRARVDRVDGARVLLAVEEPDGIAEDGDGLIDAFGGGVRVAAGLPEREVLELLAMVERRALYQRRRVHGIDALAQRPMGARRRRAS